MSQIEYIDKPDLIDKKLWSNFVLNHQRGNFFQSPEFYQVIQKTPPYYPIIIVALKSNEIVGVLLSMVQKEAKNPFGFFTARSIIWGGPLVKDNNKDVFEALLRRYDITVSRKAIFTQIRNLYKQNDEIPLLESLKYHYNKHLNILISLDESIDQIWRSIDARKRTYINRAQKDGFIFSHANSQNEIMEVHSILRNVYEKAKLPLPPLRYFQNLASVNNEIANTFLFIAKFNSEVAACFVGVCYKDRIYEYYVGTNKKFAKRNPGDFLLWEILKWGKENGYKIFDFGGAGKPDVEYGVREYKKKFGGELVEFGRFEKTHHPLMMKLAKVGFSIYQKFYFKKA